MKIKFDVSPAEYQRIHDILQAHLPADCQVWVFGSRAKHQTLHGSDLDLALEGQLKIEPTVIWKLETAFEESPLPYRVDIIDLKAISEEFFKQIKMQLVPFYEGKNQPEARIPKLRFPEFEGEWENYSINHFVRSLDAGVSVNSIDRKYVNNEKAILKTSSVNSGKFSPNENKAVIEPEEIIRLKEPVTKNTIIFSRMNTPALVGANCYVSNNLDNLYLPDRLWAAKSSGNGSLNWLSKITQSQKFRTKLSSRATGTSGSMKNISKSDLLTLNVVAPENDEQQKIASFLTKVDQKIDLLQRKKDQLTAYKKGMMQKLFPATGRQVPELRFKDENGNDFPDWEEKKLDEVADRITQKNKFDNQNVLTISAQQGLVSQMSYFNHSVAAKDLTGYYLLEKGDFAYNKSYSKGYPMGAIKKLNVFDTGVVSTLYICFRAKNSSQNSYLEKYFDSGFQNYWIQKIAQEGARNHGLLNMAVGDFFNMPIPIPHPAEQQKIADFLTALDRKIDLVTQKLTQAQTFKKGLLQKMFV